MNTQTQNYRDVIQECLTDRIKKNPSYSLRSFAKQLGLAPATLSQILSGKRDLSISRSYEIAEKIGLKQKEQKQFVLLVQISKAKNETEKDTYIKELNKLRPNGPVYDLNVDLFKIISEWYHLPILEMTNIKSLDLNEKTISKKLGISIFEAKEALKKLERLELIEKDKKGRYKKTQNMLLTQSKIPNNALRKYHRQMLEKAIVSLETQTPNEKFVGSETFAFSKENLKKANELTEKYFEQMIELAASSKKKEDVYHLGIQFFNLTKEK